MDVRRLRNFTLDGVEYEHALALSPAEFRSRLRLTSDTQVEHALDLLAGAGYLRPDVDRPERWLGREKWDARRAQDNQTRDRMLIFVGVSDPLRIAQIHRGLVHDEDLERERMRASQV